MIYKDAVIFNFFFDKEDPDELKLFEALIAAIEAQLKTNGMGKYDGYSYDAKGECFKMDILGNDAEAMLHALSSTIREAAFLIGPKATLIMRSYEQGSKAVIRHVDL